MNKVAGGRLSYAFYADGDAPSYFRGDTDFGGTLYVRQAGYLKWYGTAIDNAGLQKS